MTNQALQLNATTIGTTIADRKPAEGDPKNLISKIGKRFAHAFWQITEEYGRQANPSRFKHVL